MASFTHASRLLVRPDDVEARRWLLDLSKYAVEKASAERISSQVAAGTLPRDGAWPAGRVALFRRWIDGMCAS
jgi:hypothetical protein